MNGSRTARKSHTRSELLSRNEDDNTGNLVGEDDNTTTSSVQPLSYEANQQSSNNADDEVNLGPGNNVGQ